MRKMYHPDTGMAISVDKDQVELLLEAGYSNEPVEVQEVEEKADVVSVEAEEKSTPTVAKKRKRPVIKK